MSNELSTNRLQLNYETNQGCINGRVTVLADDNEALAAFMRDKTAEQKRLAASHLRTIRAIRKRSIAIRRDRWT